MFAVVDEAGTVLMKHGEELDSWSVIINGHVEVTLPDSGGYELHLGDRYVCMDGCMNRKLFKHHFNHRNSMYYHFNHRNYT